MIIKNLKLENYRRFRYIDLELPENLIGIIGSNGVGKTTLVEAIGWVLYGNKIRRSDKQDIRSQFSTDDDVCTVEMIFTMGGHEYRVVRKLRGKNAITEAAIYRDGGLKPEAVQEKGVNEYVEHLINLDHKSFFASVFARQRELAALSVLQPEERRRSIARLIDIDQIDRARVQVRADKNSKEGVKQGLTMQLKSEQELKQKRSDLNKDFKVKRTELSELKGFHNNQLSEFKRLKAEFDALFMLRDQFIEINSNLTTWTTRLKDFEERKENLSKQLNSIEKIEAELIPLRDEIKNFEQVKRLKEKLDAESAKYAELGTLLSKEKQLSSIIDRKREEMQKEFDKITALGDLDKKLADVGQLLLETERLLEQKDRERNDLNTELQKVTDKGLELKKQREDILKLGADSPCPVCTRPLGEHYDGVVDKFEHEYWDLRARFQELKRQVEDYDIQIDNLKKKITTIKMDKDKVIREHQSYKGRIEANHKLGKEIHGYVDERRAVQSEIKKMGKIDYDKEKHRKLRDEFERLSRVRDKVLRYEENVKQKLNLENEIKTSIKIISDLKSQISGHRQKLNDLNYDEKKYLESKQHIEKIQLDIEKSRKTMEEMNHELIKLEKDIEKITEEIETIKENTRKIKTIEEEMAYLNALDYHLGIFRQELAGRIRPVISQRASELLNLTTNGSYSLLDLDEDYNIYIFDQSEKFPINRFSGGEQDLANLCLRIAISQVVAERSGGRQVNFIVLDEIFGSQDEERKELILKMLQHLSAQFRQIFVITHVEEIKDIMPVVISVTRKNESESAVTLL
ncbi:SMC family ATPase [candidate division KSB1 bacterium]|nr:SMC family ATPase [candidate division KSB1 bacterium]